MNSIYLRSLRSVRMGVRGKERIGGMGGLKRFYSEGEKVVSPHIGFYKTFGRPIAKVLLMATFSYQFFYWGWVYLEKEEIKKLRTTEVTALEKRLEELTKGKGGVAKS